MADGLGIAPNQDYISKWVKLSIFNFLIATVYGAILRLVYIFEIPWIDFKNLLHGHSHVAMMGWIYLALLSLLYDMFVPPEKKNKNYHTLFIATQVTVIGMAISFPIQGYAFWSILFSFSYLILVYVFAIKFLKDIPRQWSNGSLLFVKTAILFLLVSTLGLLAIPVTSALQLTHTSIYYSAIQFFLHFQFNGWMIFAVLALIIKYLENQSGLVWNRSLSYFYWILVVATTATFALAVTWSSPVQLLFWINSMGVIAQLIALILFLYELQKYYHKIRTLTNSWQWTLFNMGLFSIAAKIIIQSAVMIPNIAIIAYTIRNFVIGFIHLIMLGAVSCIVLFFYEQRNWIDLQVRGTKTGISLLLAGFVLSEAVLFLQGIFFWAKLGFLPLYYEMLFCVSALIPLGILVLFWNLFLNNNQENGSS